MSGGFHFGLTNWVILDSLLIGTYVPSSSSASGRALSNTFSTDVGIGAIVTRGSEIFSIYLSSLSMIRVLALSTSFKRNVPSATSASLCLVSFLSFHSSRTKI